MIRTASINGAASAPRENVNSQRESVKSHAALGAVEHLGQPTHRALDRILADLVAKVAALEKEVALLKAKAAVAPTAPKRTKADHAAYMRDYRAKRKPCPS